MYKCRNIIDVYNLEFLKEFKSLNVPVPKLLSIYRDFSYFFACVWGKNLYPNKYLNSLFIGKIIGCTVNKLTFYEMAVIFSIQSKSQLDKMNIFDYF